MAERSYLATDLVLRSHLSWLRGWLDGAQLPVNVMAKIDAALEAEQEMRDRLYDLLGERCSCPPWQQPTLDCPVHRKAMLDAAREAVAEEVGQAAAQDVPDEIVWSVMELRRRRRDREIRALLAPYRRAPAWL